MSDGEDQLATGTEVSVFSPLRLIPQPEDGWAGRVTASDPVFTIVSFDGGTERFWTRTRVISDGRNSLRFRVAE